MPEGAPETWYDDRDSDCDGASDFDQDGDGYDSEVWGGLDCDDVDEGTHPGVTLDACYGGDEDCDGRVDEDCAVPQDTGEVVDTGGTLDTGEPDTGVGTGLTDSGDTGGTGTVGDTETSPVDKGEEAPPGCGGGCGGCGGGVPSAAWFFVLIPLVSRRRAA